MNKLISIRIFLLFIFNNFSMSENNNFINILNTFENIIVENFLKITEYNKQLYENKDQKLPLKFFKINIQSVNKQTTKDFFKNQNNKMLLEIKEYLINIQNIKYSFKNETNFIIAKVNNNIDPVSFINYQIEQYENKKFINLYNLNTNENYQRKGIANFLMNIMITESFQENNDIEKIFLYSQYDESKSNLTQNIIMPDVFYKNLGFKIKEERKIKNDNGKLYIECNKLAFFQLIKEDYLKKIKNNI